MSDQLCLELDAPAKVRPKPAFRLTAADEIRRVLQDTLPPDVPPFFARVVSAHFDGKKALGKLEMFDGMPAEIEVWAWRDGSSAYRWAKLEGGDLSWEDGRWIRCETLQ